MQPRSCRIVNLTSYSINPAENLESESPVRDCALHLSGFPLQNLSTSQVFSYVTMFAPKPIGELSYGGDDDDKGR